MVSLGCEVAWALPVTAGDVAVKEGLMEDHTQLSKLHAFDDMN